MSYNSVHTDTQKGERLSIILLRERDSLVCSQMIDVSGWLDVLLVNSSLKQQLEDKDRSLVQLEADVMRMRTLQSPVDEVRQLPNVNIEFIYNYIYNKYICFISL